MSQPNAVLAAPSKVQAALVAAPHGTSSPAGQEAVRGLVSAVARAYPELQVVESFIDVQQPSVPTVLFEVEGPARIVPFLLSAGYHVHVDLAKAAAEYPQARVVQALGPDRRLVNVLALRLQEAGLHRGDRVVLAAAGSTDARAVADCEQTARMLAEELDMPVTTGYISAAQPPLADAVATAKAARDREADGGSGRVVVASYLLAPGYFASLAADCGADIVTRPLLVPGEEPPQAIVSLVLDRFAA